VLRASNFLQEGAVLEAWLRFWIGDGVGVLVTAPLLLAAADAESRSEFLQFARRRETWLQAAVLAIALWIVFIGLGDPAAHFYLLFPPLIWVVVRGGTSGTLLAVAVIQLGIVIAIHRDRGAALPLLELQAFVAALALTALYLGMMVDERQRAAANLRQTLRLAAAGEMAGALAHELNQPLTALANYGRSAQLMLAAGGTTVDQLPKVIEQMLAEGLRAGEVVRRLRDFFRTGTTRLESVPVEHILSAAQSVARHISGHEKVAITTRTEGELPPLYIDRIQIELTLRNLIANAMEAVANRKDGSAQISVVAQRHDAQSVRITVTDNGPGIAPAVRETLFEPFATGSARGMGLGLAVSRAIAEAHGGSLTARATEHGEFEIVLPCT
jgi:signal transduction histidine kinase